MLDFDKQDSYTKYCIFHRQRQNNVSIAPIYTLPNFITINLTKCYKLRFISHMVIQVCANTLTEIIYHIMCMFSTLISVLFFFLFFYFMHGHILKIKTWFFIIWTTTKKEPQNPIGILPWVFLFSDVVRWKSFEVFSFPFYL